MNTVTIKGVNTNLDSEDLKNHPSLQSLKDNKSLFSTLSGEERDEAIVQLLELLHPDTLKKNDLWTPSQYPKKEVEKSEEEDA